jgi:hypothetical protein
MLIRSSSGTPDISDLRATQSQALRPPSGGFVNGGSKRRVIVCRLDLSASRQWLLLSQQQRSRGGPSATKA